MNLSAHSTLRLPVICSCVSRDNVSSLAVMAFLLFISRVHAVHTAVQCVCLRFTRCRYERQVLDRSSRPTTSRNDRSVTTDHATIPLCARRRYFTIGSIGAERLAVSIWLPHLTAASSATTKVERNAPTAARWTVTVGQLDDERIDQWRHRALDGQSDSQPDWPVCLGGMRCRVTSVRQRWRRRSKLDCDCREEYMMTTGQNDTLCYVSALQTDVNRYVRPTALLDDVINMCVSAHEIMTLLRGMHLSTRILHSL